MLANFDRISDEARVWVYQADRKLDAAEKSLIDERSAAFLNQWAAHGSDLQAASAVLYDHFLIICIDESFQMASGCSIDSSVRFVQELGSSLGVDFFKRTNLAFEVNGGIELIEMSQIKSVIQQGNLSADSLFFDNNIQTKGQLAGEWKVKASESWLKRYFKATLNV